MKHRQIQRNLGRYADGELNRGQASEVADHLRLCAVCQTRLAELRSLEESLSQYETAPPPDLLSHHILRAASLGREPSGTQDSRSRITRSWIRWPAAAAAATAAVLLGSFLGQAGLVPRDRQPARQTIASTSPTPDNGLSEAFGLLPEGDGLLELLDLSVPGEVTE